MADGLNINLSQASIDKFKDQINQLKTQAEQENVKINIDINNENIRGQIEAVQSVLNSLQNNTKPIEINLDTIKAREKLTEIKGTYQDVFNELSKIGNVQIKPIKIDAEGNIQSFIAQLEQIPGLMQKIKFADSGNGLFTFDPNSVITETSNIAKLTEQVDKFRDKRQSLLNEIKDTNLGDTSKINEAQKSLDSLNFTNFKSKINEVDSLMNDVNKSFKNAFNVDQAGRSLNQKLEQLKESSKYLNSENINGLQDKVGDAKSLEDIQQLTNQYKELINEEKERKSLIESMAKAHDKSEENAIKRQQEQEKELNKTLQQEELNRQKIQDAIAKTIQKREEENKVLEQNQAKASNKALEDNYKQLQRIQEFKDQYNQKISDFSGKSQYVNPEEISNLQNKINGLNGTESTNEIQKIKNALDGLIDKEKELNNNARDVESTYKSLESQIQKINNIKNGYNGKLDTGNTQYLELEVQADKLIEKLQQYQSEEKILSTKEISDIQEEVNAYKKKANEVEDVTKFVKQQENAVDALKNKFGNLFSDSDVSKLKENLQSVLSLGSLNSNDKDTITSFIANKEKELTELKRVSSLGANVGSLSGSGLNMESSIQDVDKYVQSILGAKASVSSITESEDKFGNAVKTANVSVDEGNNIVSKYKVTLDSASNSIYKTSTGVQDLSSKHATLGESIQNAMAGFLKFQVVAVGVMGAINALKEGISTINSLNESMTNIAMVTGDSMDKVKQYMNQYTQLSQQLHTTTSDVATAAEEFLRAGDSQQESMKMVQAATVMAKEAGMTQEEASQGLIAIANAYGILPDKIMNVVDMMTKLDNISSSSVSEMNTALTKVASSANEVGVPLNKLLSYITEISSVTRTAPSTIGTGLNSIFSRFSSIKMGKNYDPNSGEALNNVEKSLQTVGISIRKDKDTFKDFSTVLDGVGEHWDKYTDRQKNLISTQMAGKMLAPLYGDI